MTEKDNKTGDQALDEEGATLKAHFARVMWVHGPMIYTLAYRLTGNQVEGQNLAQETFVKAYANHTQFRVENTLGTWLYRICVDAWKNKVSPRKRGKDKTEFLEIIPADQHLSANLEGLTQEEAVKVALAQLTPPERALIVMRDMDGKSYEEICEMLDTTLDIAKSRIARTREKLRVLLEPLVKKES